MFASAVKLPQLWTALPTTRMRQRRYRIDPPMDSAARTQPREGMPSRECDTRDGGSFDPDAVAEAIRRFQAGSERDASFRTLFELYHPNVERFFVRRTASVDRSLDLTQETFLRVYKGLDGYRWQAPFGAWLFRIAWNVLKTSATRAESSWPTERQVELEESLIDAARRTAGGDAAAGERPAYRSILRQQQRRLLMQAVERLPPQRRRCIVLWAYHQLTYEQIGVALRISIGTVKAHMSQARRQLETLLDELREEGRHG